jgi:hypothetical protein
MIPYYASSVSSEISVLSGQSQYRGLPWVIHAHTTMHRGEYKRL